MTWFKRLLFAHENHHCKDESLSKFYVAVTRARYSVAFVYKTKRLPTNDIGTKWTPDVLE